MARIGLDNEEALKPKKNASLIVALMEVPESFMMMIAYVNHKVKRRELGLE